MDTMDKAPSFPWKQSADDPTVIVSVHPVSGKPTEVLQAGSVGAAEAVLSAVEDIEGELEDFYVLRVCDDCLGSGEVMETRDSYPYMAGRRIAVTESFPCDECDGAGVV